MNDEKFLKIELSDDDDSSDYVMPSHPPKMLDLAFLMDCTGSMSPYIWAVNESIEEIVDSIAQYDVRLGLVEFQDHRSSMCSSSYVTRSHDFTRDKKTMRQWLDDAEAFGGGDYPEAIADAIRAALRDLNWRQDATKICVLITDSIPHGLGYSMDDYDDGCPKGYDPVRLVHRMAENDITLYCVGCEPDVSSYREFYKALALITGGRYVPLRHAHLLKEVIIGGVSEELSVRCLEDALKDEIEDRISSLQDPACQGQIDVDQLVERLENYLKLQGKTVTQFQISANSAKVGITDAVKRMSQCTDLKAVRQMFQPTTHRSSRSWRRRSYSLRRSWSRSRSRSFRSRSRSSRSRSRSRSRRSRIRRSRSRSRSCSRSMSRSRSRSPNYSVVQTAVNSALLRRLVDKIMQKL